MKSPFKFLILAAALTLTVACREDDKHKASWGTIAKETVNFKLNAEVVGQNLQINEDATGEQIAATEPDGIKMHELCNMKILKGTYATKTSGWETVLKLDGEDSSANIMSKLLFPNFEFPLPSNYGFGTTAYYVDIGEAGKRLAITASVMFLDEGNSVYATCELQKFQ